jgi:hypothetical protein
MSSAIFTQIMYSSLGIKKNHDIHFQENRRKLLKIVENRRKLLKIAENC